MNRRTLVVVAVVAVMTASAHAGDPARAREVALPQAEQRPLELHEIFAMAPGVITETGNGIVSGPMQADVIVARIGSDGKLVRACVNTEEAARRFLDAPIEKVEGGRAKEQ
jgi:hypothetical protein